MKKILSMLLVSNVVMPSIFTSVSAVKLTKSDLSTDILRKVETKKISSNVLDYLLKEEVTQEQLNSILDSDISNESLAMLMKNGADKNVIESVIDLKISQKNMEYLFEDLDFPMDLFRALLDLKISGNNLNKLENLELSLEEYKLLIDLKISDESIKKLTDLMVSENCFKTLLDLRICDDDLKKILSLNLRLTSFEDFIRLELRPAKLKAILEMNLSREEFTKFVDKMISIPPKYLKDIDRDYDLDFCDLVYCFVHDLEFNQMKIRKDIIRKIRTKKGILLEDKFFDLQEPTWRQNNVQMSEYEMGMRIRELVPNSGFDNFVFGEDRRYDRISEDQRNQLKLILSLEDEIICDEDCCAKIQAIFSDHEDMCPNRLSSIIFEASAVIDEFKGIDNGSISAILTKYRNALAEELTCKPHQGYESLYTGFVQDGYGAEYQLKYKSELKGIWAISMPKLTQNTYYTISDIVIDEDFIAEVMYRLFSLDSIKKTYVDSINDDAAFQRAVEKRDVSFDDYEKFTNRQQILKEKFETIAKSEDFNSMTDFLNSTLEKELSDKDKKMFENFKAWYEGESKLSVEDIVETIVAVLSEMNFEDYKEFPEFGEIKSYEKNILAEKFVEDLFNNKYIKKCRTME